MTKENDQENILNELRSKIDFLDSQLIELINKRSEFVIKIGKFKEKQESPLYRPVREQKIYDTIAKINKGPFKTESFLSVYREIMSGSLSLEGELSVAYLGPEATFTHLAAKKKFGSSVTLEPLSSIPEIFEKVENGKYTYGIVPIENSNEGMVTHTLDEFIDSELFIYSELFLNISHCLLSNAENILKIKKVYSHRQSLGQCKMWLMENMPNVELVETSSNAKAAIRAKSEMFSAAIASDISAELYELKILAKDIQDFSNNVTRFLIIGKDLNQISNNDKTSILCSIKDRPGALFEMIEPFYRHKINMTKIESRPTKKQLWEYNFFIDFIGHYQEPKVQQLLEELRSKALHVKFLGSYPKGLTY